jgi:hypothetical protein
MISTQNRSFRVVLIISLLILVDVGCCSNKIIASSLEDIDKTSKTSGSKIKALAEKIKALESKMKKLMGGFKESINNGAVATSKKYEELRNKLKKTGSTTTVEPSKS